MFTGFSGNCIDMERPRFAWKLIPISLNEVTRSTEPVGIERRWKLAALKRPRNIGLVFAVFICILLLAVHKRRVTCSGRYDVVNVCVHC